MLDSYITFQVDWLSGKKLVLVSGKKAANTNNAWTDGWYNLIPPIALVNGVPNPAMAGPLSWCTVDYPFSPGQVVASPTYCHIWGVKAVGSPPEWVLFTAGIPAGGTYTFPDDAEAYRVTLQFYELIGENLMAGQLGKYKYNDDTGIAYTIVMDKSNADAVGNEAADAAAIAQKPSALTLRYILCRQSDNPQIKRKIVIGKPDNAKYKTGGTVSLETIAGAKDFKITGRIGEKFSF